jgi:(p)ppGpp synthase/HD superfamily hydrolase
MDSLITKAFLLAKKAHQGQTDIGGSDYFRNHITTVFNSVGGFSANPPELAIVALLHDSVEDTSVTLKEIESEFGPTVANAVRALTKTSGSNDVKHVDYSYLRKIKSNTLARKVKIADITNNMDLTRIKNPTPKDVDRLERYTISLDYLK